MGAHHAHRHLTYHPRRGITLERYELHLNSEAARFHDDRRETVGW
jgi:hypothetical protein